MSTIRVCDRKGIELLIINNITKETTVDDIKQVFAQKYPKYYPDRQYYTIGLDSKSRVSLKANDLLSAYNQQLHDNQQIIYFKDLGAQISWKTVFHVEYFGPILIHTINYFLPSLFYSASTFHHTTTNPIWYQYHPIQTIMYLCIVLHFVKRELETHYVHRFSNSTMPLVNIFKNSIHYWLFSGLFISYYLYHPQYTPSTIIQTYLLDTQIFKPIILYSVIIGLYVTAESGNLACHIILRDLRPAGSTKRGIPHGNLFELCSCANYTWELLIWLIIAISIQCVTGYIFLLISFAQISQWALKKHRAYIKEFGRENAKPYALIPFVF